MIIYVFNLLVKTITLDLRGKMMELTEGQEIKFYLISEAALNTQGERQVKRLGNYFYLNSKGITHVYTSP
jgi:hypothetical protein